MCCNFQVSEFQFQSTQYEHLGTFGCPYYDILGQHSVYTDNCKVHGNFSAAKDDRPDLIEVLSSYEIIKFLRANIEGDVLVLQNICLKSEYLAALQRINALRGGRVMLYDCTAIEDLDISGPILANYIHIISCNFRMVHIADLISKTQVFVDDTHFDVLHMRKSIFRNQIRIESGSARRMHAAQIKTNRSFVLSRFKMSSVDIIDSKFNDGLEFSR